MNNLFTTLNVPPMSNVLFKRQEREIGNAVENVVKKSCKQILEQEKKKSEEKSQNQGGEDGLVGIAVSYDMGWQKRGKGHNSLTGHGTVMGLVTGKVLSYSTRCKSCRVCDSSNRSGTAVKNHDCSKNHTGSSKSMERDVACELWSAPPPPPKQVLNSLLMLEMMIVQLWQIYMLKCHRTSKSGLTLFILKDL